MFGLTALELARIQFGFTISAHIIFPPICLLAKPFAAAILIKCLEAALEGHRGEANT